MSSNHHFLDGSALLFADDTTLSKVPCISEKESWSSFGTSWRLVYCKQAEDKWGQDSTTDVHSQPQCSIKLQQCKTCGVHSVLKTYLVGPHKVAVQEAIQSAVSAQETKKPIVTCEYLKMAYHGLFNSHKVWSYTITYVAWISSRNASLLSREGSLNDVQ